MRAFSLVWLGLLALALCGCTKPPAMPELSYPKPTALERILLHETITAEDVRNLFRAVNFDGRLDSLKAYLETPDDETLGKLAGLATRYLYNDAHTPQGFPQLLRARIEKRSFSAILDSVRRWSETEGADAEREAGFYFLSLAETPKLLERDIGLLDPEWTKILSHTWDRARESELFQAGTGGGWPSPEAIVADMRRFFGDTGTYQAFVSLGDSLIGRDFGLSLLKTFYAARSQTGAKAARGLGEGIKKLIASGNSLEGVFRLVRVLDGPPNGLFTTPEAKLRKEPDSIREIALLFQPMITRGTAGLVRESLTKARVMKGLKERFMAIRSGIEQITGGARDDDAPDFLLYNLPIYLNAYAIDSWLEAVRAEPANKALSALIATEGYSETVWETEVALPALKLSFIEAGQDGDYHLTPKIKKELDGIGLDAFTGPLDSAVKNDGLGNFIYKFPKGEKPVKLREAFAEAVRLIDRVRPFADPSSFVRALAFQLTRAASGRKTLFESLETTPNLMDALNGLIDLTSGPRWPEVKRLLFEDMKISELASPSSSQRKLLLSLYVDKPEVSKRLEEILSRLPDLEAFDNPVGDLPSPFSMYQRVLGFLPREERHDFVAVLSFVSDSGLVARGPNGPNYPALHAFLAEGTPLAKLVYLAGSVDPRDRSKLAAVADDVLGRRLGYESGLELHTRLFKNLLDAYPAAVASLIRRAEGGSLFPWSDGESDAMAGESAWLERLVRAGDHNELWSFFRAHGSRADLHALAADLERLSKQGYLRDAFRLLSQVNNERIQEIARVLDLWEKSGELGAFLETARLILKP